MNLDSYEYVPGRTLFDFEFDSVGPKGIIRKRISYSLRNISGYTCFNIGFGDIDSQTGQISDLTVSNNQDVVKILGTLSNNILDFTSKFSDMLYYIEGSTPSRTRLYQISITKNIVSIKKIYELYGLINNNWELFTTGRNYSAFLLHRKSI